MTGLRTKTLINACILSSRNRGYWQILELLGVYFRRSSTEAEAKKALRKCRRQYNYFRIKCAEKVEELERKAQGEKRKPLKP